jgi:hypothetical protein
MAYMIDASGNLVPATGNMPGNVIEKNFTLSHQLGNAQAGEQVLLAVTPSDTSQSLELETYLGGYRQRGFGADLVSRTVPTEKEEYKRRDFSHLNVFAPTPDDVGRSGAINQVEHISELVPGKTKEHALAAFIPYAAEHDAVGTYKVRAAHTKMLRDKLDLNREIRIMDRASATSTWHANNYMTITTAFRWNTGTTRDPLADIYARLHQSWMPVTKIVMNLAVSEYFLADAKVIAHADFRLGTAGAKTSLMTESEAPGVQRFDLPGLPPFYIVDSKKFENNVMTPILADDVLFLSTPETLAGGETMASLLSFRYQGRSGTGYTVNEYQPYGRGLNGGVMLEAGYADDDVVVSQRAGGLIKSVLTGT